MGALAREVGDRIEPGQAEEAQVALVPPYRPQHRLSEAELGELFEAYCSGKTALEVAKLFGVHRQTVTRLLVKHGVPLHPRIVIDEKPLAELTWHYERGRSTVELGRMYNLAASSVGKALKKSGVQLRPPKFNRWEARDE